MRQKQDDGREPQDQNNESKSEQVRLSLCVCVHVCVDRYAHRQQVDSILALNEMMGTCIRALFSL